MSSVSTHKELGFLALISIVIGSQIGSGTFVIPTLMAPFGTVGLLGWVVSVAGIISLAVIFSDLAAKMPQTGGPHVYVMKAFGRAPGFFTAWIYWIISWSSNSVLLVASIHYLSAITGPLHPVQIIVLETIALFAITFVNIVGIKFSGRLETILVFLKVIPLLVLPILFLTFFNIDNFNLESAANSLIKGDIGENIGIISKTALLTSWSFIGVECATTPAERVHNPKKTIPRAIIVGTICVAIIYIINVVSVFGVTGFEDLIDAKAPYALAMNKTCGYSSNVLISILAIVICIGTLNAWTLTGGQIAQGAAEAGLFPPIFAKTNKKGAPTPALLMAAVGIIPFFIVEQICGNEGLDYLVGLLVSIFLFVYLACIISYVKFIKTWKKNISDRIKAYALAIFALSFCVFIAAQDILSSVIVLAIFILIGLPVYLRTSRRA